LGSNQISGAALLIANNLGRNAMPSTAIRNLFYVPAKRELWVTFVSGRRYVYAEVPPEVFYAFKAAESRGAFFNHEIRERFAFREVTRERSGWTVR
jgi:KTSC domain